MNDFIKVVLISILGGIIAGLILLCVYTNDGHELNENGQANWLTVDEPIDIESTTSLDVQQSDKFNNNFVLTVNPQ